MIAERAAPRVDRRSRASLPKTLNRKKSSLITRAHAPRRASVAVGVARTHECVEGGPHLISQLIAKMELRSALLPSLGQGCVVVWKAAAAQLRQVKPLPGLPHSRFYSAAKVGTPAVSRFCFLKSISRLASTSRSIASCEPARVLVVELALLVGHALALLRVAGVARQQLRDRGRGELHHPDTVGCGTTATHAQHPN